MLRVIVEERGDIVILHCEGRIVRGEETALLCAAARHYGRTIALDLSQVDTIDAAGVGALVALQAAGIYLRLRNLTTPVREVMRITQLDSLFEIDVDRSRETTVSAAVKHDPPAATLPAPVRANG